MLAVNVPSEAAIGLRKRSDDVKELLALIPIDTDLTQPDQSGFDERLGKGSAGREIVGSAQGQ